MAEQHIHEVRILKRTQDYGLYFDWLHVNLGFTSNEWEEIDLGPGEPFTIGFTNKVDAELFVKFCVGFGDNVEIQTFDPNIH